MLLVGWIIWIIALIGAIAICVNFIRENNYIGTARITIVFIVFSIFYTSILMTDFPAKNWILSIFWGLVILTGCIIVLPVKSRIPLQSAGVQERIDERDALYHRFYRLKPGTMEYNTYYRQHPELEKIDNEIRAMPGLAAPGAATYTHFTAPFTQASFSILDELTRDIDWQPKPLETHPQPVSAKAITHRLKGFAQYLGAALVGTTSLNPAYIYSHIGRSPGHWGTPIELKHTHALVIAVEMRYEMLRHAPESPTLTETAFQYLEAAKIAMVLARYIHFLGYRARAHVDGNYRVMCIPIAVDAGLGEPGRSGLLITPELGPRVRLAVITTTLPLLQDHPRTFGVQHFCRICKKCATHCPSKSIAFGEKQIVNGMEKWQSQQLSCYRYWRTKGTDCSICVKVCPYSYPNSTMHNFMRWLVRRNNMARKMAFWGNRLFYGERERRKYALPRWY